jgi:hypothetical protein
MTPPVDKLSPGGKEPEVTVVVGVGPPVRVKEKEYAVPEGTSLVGVPEIVGGTPETTMVKVSVALGVRPLAAVTVAV